MRGISRGLLQCLDNHTFHVVISDCTRRTRTRIVRQPVQTTFNKPGSPLTDRGWMHPQLLCNIIVGGTRSARQHDPAS